MSALLNFTSLDAMVTFITILQVNLVMSILLYVMFLAYLYGISDATVDRQWPTQDPINVLIKKLLQAELSRSREKQHDDIHHPSLNASGLSSAALRPSKDHHFQLLRQHKRFNSPRVLLSDRPPLQPPPLYLKDDFVSSQDGNKTRKKRNTEHRRYVGEFSVCDSQSMWVDDRTTAVDSKGRQVTILESFSVGSRDIRQFFYETKCQPSKTSRGGCRGVDEKHWNSQCKPRQSLVRALTQTESLVHWNWIWIDTSCACAISRKHRRT